MELGNPYVIDRPLAEGEVFVDRHKLLAEVLQAVRGGQGLILVYGSARMGKTSFLRQLASELRDEFRPIAVEVAWPQSATSASWPQLRTRVEESLSHAGSLDDAERRNLVLVDGLRLADLFGEAGSEFLASWQGWISTLKGTQFMVTIEGTVQGSAVFSPSLTSVPAVQLDGFSLEDAEELLIRTGKGHIQYEFAAIRRIWQLTSGHPYFAQVFGYTLVASHVEQVRVPDVDQALAEVLATTQSVMQRMWSGASRKAQAALVLSNELKGRHGVVTVSELRNQALRQAVELSEQDIEVSLNEWLASGALSRLGPGSYALCCSLLGLWLAEQKPTAQTLRELKFRKGLSAPQASGSPRRYLRWSSFALELAVVGLGAIVLVLWNMRGAAQQLTMGPSPTQTPLPIIARPTLEIGPQLGTIAYMAKDDPEATWNIWAMRGDGSDPRRLTDDPGDEVSPTWSPDGKQLAFVSNRDGNREIYVMKADGSQQVNLTHHASEDWTPAWSPDGKEIAFSSYRDGNWEIYVMDVSGSNLQRLTAQSGADYGPAWSPDGQEIAFHSNRDGNWEIYSLHRDGTGLRRLTENEATDFAPAWSPDGEMIAFESYRDGNMEIYLMAADGSDQRNVSNDPYSNEHGPTWAWDGTKLLYFSNRDSGWDIFSMQPDGNEKRNLTLSPSLEQGPRWRR